MSPSLADAILEKPRKQIFKVSFLRSFGQVPHPTGLTLYPFYLMKYIPLFEPWVTMETKNREKKIRAV